MSNDDHAILLMWVCFLLGFMLLLFCFLFLSVWVFWVFFVCLFVCLLGGGGGGLIFHFVRLIKILSN